MAIKVKVDSEGKAVFPESWLEADPTPEQVEARSRRFRELAQQAREQLLGKMPEHVLKTYDSTVHALRQALGMPNADFAALKNELMRRQHKEEERQRSLAQAARGEYVVVRTVPEDSRKAARDRTMIQELQGVRQDLQEVHRRLEAEQRDRLTLEEQVAEQEARLALYQTGAPGRRGSAHLIQQEFDRRVAASELEPTITEQARVLIDWLKSAHPKAAPIKARTAENTIRAAFKRAKSKSNQRTK